MKILSSQNLTQRAARFRLPLYTAYLPLYTVLNLFVSETDANSTENLIGAVSSGVQHASTPWILWILVGAGSALAGFIVCRLREMYTARRLLSSSKTTISENQLQKSGIPFKFFSMKSAAEIFWGNCHEYLTQMEDQAVCRLKEIEQLNQSLREIQQHNRQNEQRRILQDDVMKQIGCLVFWVSADGTIQDFSEGVEPILQFNRSELLNQKFETLLTDEADDFWAVFYKSVCSNEMYQFCSALEDRDGSIYPVELTAKGSRTGSPETLCILVRILDSDLTAAPVSANTSRQSESMEAICTMLSSMESVQDDFQKAAHLITETAVGLMDVSRAGIWLLNDNETQLRCMDLYEKQSGSHLDHFNLPMDNCPAYFQAIQSGRIIDTFDARRDPKTRELYETYLKPNGIMSRLDIAIRIGGKLVGVFSLETVEQSRSWTSEDILTAAQLTDQTALLLAWTQQGEVQSEAQAEIQKMQQFCVAKSEFLASMSHEIRTPMNAIVGFGDVLSEESLTDEQNHYVRIIQNSAKNMLALINDILDYSKIEAGKLHVEITECGLAELMEDIDSLVRPTASRKQLDFQVLQCEELPEKIMTDPVRLRQCLLNLTNNAVKFTEAGYVYLNVSLISEGLKQYIRFDVEDTGVGIAADQQEAIFDPYIQVKNSQGLKSGGTGLGLAITKKLADLLGGTISVTSCPQKGSVFTLQIPYARKEQNQSNLYNKYDKAQEATAMQANNKLSGNLLVVEDNPANQALISLLLKKMGLNVTIAMDGQDGVEKAAQGDYDIILMDMQMPRMNGYEATQYLRREGYTLPIIAVTANAMKGDKEKCLESGCTDYISKPVDKKKLHEMIESYLPGKIDISARKESEL